MRGLAAPTLLCLLLAACSGARSSSQEAAAPGPSPGVAPLPPPDPREAKLAAAIVQLLEHHHLNAKPIDDEMSRAIFDRYLDQLDPGKMFLLAADRAALEAHADRIDDQLRSGRLDLAHEGAEAYATRLATVQKVVAELLAAPLDLDDEEFFEADPEKMELAADEAELRDRWRRRLELDVLERVSTMEDRLAALADPEADKKQDDDDEADDAGRPELTAAEIPDTFEGREAKARTELAESYAARFARLAAPDPLDAAADLINAVTASYDPHTTYLPPDDKANFDIQISGSLEGIGAVLSEDDHYIRVVEVVPGGAAWRHGVLEPGDLILNVGKVDVADMRIDEVVKLIRGPKGTDVTITLQKPTKEVKTITITRDVIVIEEAYAKGAVLELPAAGKVKGKKFGYIYLPSFYGGDGDTQRTAAKDVGKLLAEMADQKLPGVVIDIRSNGGGLLGDSVDMTGLLIDRGPVVQTKDAEGTEVLRDDSRGEVYDGAVVLMVDRFSASASEIVAGALQDYQRVVVVGTGPTHGKGTVQVIAELDRLTGDQDKLGVLKLTIQQFFRVSGASTQWQGVTPDILIPDPAGHIDAGERELENSIPYSSIDPVDHDDWQPTWNLPALTEASVARVTKNETFAKLATRTALLKKRREETRVPLARAAFLQRRKDDRAALEASSPDLDGGPDRFTVTLLGGEDEQDKRTQAWREGLAHDPWIEESVLVLRDMVTAKPVK